VTPLQSELLWAALTAPTPVAAAALRTVLDALDPSPQSNSRITASERRPHLTARAYDDSIVVTELGVSLAGQTTDRMPEGAEQARVSGTWGSGLGATLPMRQVGVTREGKPIEVHADATVEEVAALVHPDHREVFRDACGRVLPTNNSKIPGIVVEAWLRVRARSADRPEQFARYGLADAYQAGGEAQGARDRGRCWNRTIDERYVLSDGTTHRRIRGGPCGSWRCPDCLPGLVATERAKLRAQIEADQARGTDDYVLIVVTADPHGWYTPAEATVAVTRGGRGPWRRFNDRLRRRYPDREYQRVVERTDAGWPHVVLLVRSADLVEAMVEEAGVVDREALRALVREIDIDNRQRKAEGKRQRPMPYSEVAGQIKEMARASEYGSQCYVGLVWSGSEIANEVIKGSQVDDCAPPGVRRLQPSRGFFTEAQAAEADAGPPLCGEVEVPFDAAPRCAGTVSALQVGGRVPDGAELVATAIHRRSPAQVIEDDCMMAHLRRDSPPAWGVTECIVEGDYSDVVQRVTRAVEMPADRFGYLERLHDARDVLLGARLVGLDVRAALEEIQHRIDEYHFGLDPPFADMAEMAGPAPDVRCAA